MRQSHFRGRGSALRLLGVAAACTIAAASNACQLKVTDETGAGGSSQGVGGSVSNGAGGTNATSGSAQGGSTAGASSTANNVEDCGHPDALANDDREHAIDFGSGATICVKNSSDDDWFYVDTPSDKRAHVIQLDLAETAGSWVTFHVIADADGSDLGEIHPSQRGLKTSAFVTVGPGTRTLFDFSGFVDNTDTTTIKVSVSAEADDHEPNNDRASATKIQTASEISAQLLMPYVSETDHPIQDWYSADLTAGKHTFQLTSVPSDLFPGVQVVDSAGTIITTEHGPNRGAKFSFSFSAEQAGTYFFKVESFVDVYVLYSGTKPDSYSQQYKFQLD